MNGEHLLTLEIQKVYEMEEAYGGTLLIRTPPPRDLVAALCLGTYGDPRGGGRFL